MRIKHLPQVFLSGLGLISFITAPSAVAGTTGEEGELDVPIAEAYPSIPAGGLDVGISARDGVTYSVPDVLVTRNGVTERLTYELRMPNGTRVMPNGTVILAGGMRIQLRPEQVLTLGGQLEDAPIAEAVAVDTRAGFNASGIAVLSEIPRGPRARPAARRLTRATRERISVGQPAAPAPTGVPTESGAASQSAAPYDSAPYSAPILEEAGK